MSCYCSVTLHCQEDFAGYTDSAIEDVAKRYRALIKASEVVNIGQEHRSASTDHRITKPSSSVLPTGFSLSSPVIPRLCGSVTRFPGSFPRPSGSILSVQAGTVPVPCGSCAPKSRTFSELSQSIPRLSGTDHECPTRAALESKDTCKVSRSLYLEQTEVSRHDPEQYSNTDWNHNQVAPSRPPKVKSGKAGSLWQCRRKGFERRWIRKRDAAIYGRSPASRHREEERYLAEEEILSGTISPDSGSKYDVMNMRLSDASRGYLLTHMFENPIFHFNVIVMEIDILSFQGKLIGATPKLTNLI